MAQDDDINNHNAPPATSSDSMNPCKDSNGGEDSSSSRLVVVGAIDKGKGVAKTEGEDQAGRSDGKISPPHVAAATRDGRLGGRHGERELHITTERERRKRMSEMFTKLCGLLPTLPDKVLSFCYTRDAAGTRQGRCRSQRWGLIFSGGDSTYSPSGAGAGSGIWPTGEAPTSPVTVGAVPPVPVGLQTWSGQNVVLSLSGNDAWINVCVARRPGVLTMVMAVLKKHNINVVTSGISSDNAWTMFTIHARFSVMAQDSDNNNHNAQLATSSDSMSPCKDNNGSDESKSSSHPVVVSAIDKGKSVIKTEGEDEGGRSKGKINTPHVVAAARDGRLGGRHGNRELHIATEHDRRKRMREMFTKLHDLLPTLPDKVDKSSIVMEAIHYIKSLEETLSELEKCNLEMQLA
ncbi:hypothetical protein ACQ4PT_014543 [Festuca glaucescens]